MFTFLASSPFINTTILKRRYQVAFRATNFFEILGRELDLIEAFPSVFYEIVESDKSITSTSASPSGEFSQGKTTINSLTVVCMTSPALVSFT